MYDVIALGELLVDFAPVSTDGEGYPTLKANPGGSQRADAVGGIPGGHRQDQ